MKAIRISQTTIVLFILAFLAAAALKAGVSQPPHPLPLRVVNRQLCDVNNKPVRLRGVNTCGMEWSSNGEGRILDSIRKAIEDWRVNVIRLPLSQDRWFGKTPEQKDSGAEYRKIVAQAVDLCSSRGVYIILDLHWSNAGEWGQNIGQRVMPDRNSVEFWRDAATTYANHPAVLFDLYNEPHDVSWDIWLKGGPVKERDRRRNLELSFDAVGMQSLLDTVRATGAKNVVIVGGLDWAYDFSGILDGRELNDRNGNGIVYANHAYPIKGDSVERWVGKMEVAAKRFPILIGEFGAEGRASGGGRGEEWVRQVLQALHTHDWHWTAWVFHPHAGPRMLTDWNYTPTPSFGRWVKMALDGSLPEFDQKSETANSPVLGRKNSDSLLGIFDGHVDIGEVHNAGTASFDSKTSKYTVSGSGGNMWFDRDAFHFAWAKLSGDCAITADIDWPGAGKHPHRKAVLMLRQDLDADSKYVDAALHGDGLTSLQFRLQKGAATHEIQSNVAAPTRVRLERRGQFARLFLAAAGQELRFSGAAVPIEFGGAVFVGIGVCAHDQDSIEAASFTNVQIDSPTPKAAGTPKLVSTLETQSVDSTDRRIVHVSATRIEAPNWSHDGQSLIVNGDGRLYSIPVSGGNPQLIETGFATRCNNDHGFSPDGKLLAISDQSQGKKQSLIYTLPVGGGLPKLVTPNGPSYWHGWSPDGRRVTYCGERNGEFDIYTIDVAGGAETRLTTSPGLDDGPEYSPDGQHIYFNSIRTGRMQIWRMRSDGSEQTQVFSDEWNNWFPHLSPDGRRMVFLSYDKDVTGHPENKNVSLRMMRLADKRNTTLGRFLGGQGTINVPSWSPDGRRIAFVSFQLIP